MIKIKEIECSKLIPYENNARINDGAVEAVANSIKEFGMKNPIIIDKEFVIIAGHTRLKALEKLGIEKAPCIIADDLTEDQIKAFRIADNSTGQIAEWDLEKLQAELDSIDMDMLQFGIGEQLEEIDKFIDENKEAVEDDFEMPEEIEPRVKEGEVWQLGKHRLMCGDSTKESDVSKLMDGKLADLVVTDPPYNVDYEGGTGLKIKNDNMNDNEFLLFLQNAFNNMNNNLKDGGVFYIWCIDHKIDIFMNALKIQKLQHHETLIWNKNTFVLGHLDYHKKHEPCLYGWKEGAAHYFTDDRTQSTVFEDAQPDFKKMKKDELVKLLEEVYSDKISTTIINEDKPLKSDLHPTMKPVKLIGRLIKNSSKQGELVVDLFGGSGTTLIACEQLNRKCNIMEFDPKYATVIIDRWEQLTGQKAIKLK